jgi:2-polyprenyl-3-methyl-5-hydroxy-6-metoxy-1,4-benzoquinol methylase
MDGKKKNIRLFSFILKDRSIMNNFEEYYNGFYKELSKLDELGNTFSKIETFLPNLKGDESFLDIGCGHGSVSSELIKRGYKVSGIEINKDAIRSLESKGFEVFQKDISKPLELHKRFDVVMILDVLEHMFDPYFLLNEAKKLQNRGGSNHCDSSFIFRYCG